MDGVRTVSCALSPVRALFPRSVRISVARALQTSAALPRKRANTNRKRFMKAGDIRGVFVNPVLNERRTFVYKNHNYGDSAENTGSSKGGKLADLYRNESAFSVEVSCQSSALVEDGQDKLSPGVSYEPRPGWVVAS